MTQFDFIPYMKNVAETLKELKHSNAEPHFHRASSMVSMEEFLTKMQETTGFQLIAIAQESGKYIDRKSDNLLDQPYYSFYVMTVAEHGDFDARQEAISDCKRVAKKILSKLFRDQTNRTHGLNYLDRGSITYNQAGPFAHNWFGMNYNFTLISASDIRYNGFDWDV